MKKQLTLLGVSAFLAAGMAIGMPQDQSAPPPQENGGRPAHRQMDPAQRTKMLAKRLKLSDDQQKQILPILTDQQQQMENLRSDTSVAPTDKREKMRSIRDDSETKLKTVLTDSQKQQYDQMQQQMRERMQQRRGAAPGAESAPPPPNN